MHNFHNDFYPELKVQTQYHSQVFGYTNTRQITSHFMNHIASNNSALRQATVGHESPKHFPIFLLYVSPSNPIPPPKPCSTLTRTGVKFSQIHGNIFQTACLACRTLIVHTFFVRPKRKTSGYRPDAKTMKTDLSTLWRGERGEFSFLEKS